MTTVTVTEAQKRLPELFEAAQRGEEIEIQQDGVTVTLVVKSEPIAEPPPVERIVRFGLFKDSIEIVDPDWDKPMTDEEIRETFGDDYIG